MEELENASLFQLLSLSLGNAALIALGVVPENGAGPSSSQPVRLDAAKYNIEMLEMLEKKTKGNLTGDETLVLEGLLFDLRMKYVEASKNA